MKVIYKLFIVSIIVSSCSSNDLFDPFKNACNVNNPVGDLAWLKTEIEQREANISEFSKYDYITLSSFNKEPVLIYANCNPLANSIFVVLNCNGENIGYIGDDNFSLEVLNKGRIIWRPEDFVCTD